ncbi:MAG: hypothetical protein H6579_01425 [Chitinophagales bacterium]|nr:hypothetical protein [Chitinophagales bacterium]
MGDSKLGIGSRVNHPKYGLGVVCNLDSRFYKIYFSTQDECKEIAREFEALDVVEKIDAPANSIGLEDIEKAVENVMLKFSDAGKVIPLANKWINGTLEIKAASSDLQSKEIPIRTFFNKIIMVRERLRVLEQNINNHEKLDEADKLHLQQYISRAYGSLTTFNVLFNDKNDYFKGTGKES